MGSKIIDRLLRPFRSLQRHSHALHASTSTTVKFWRQIQSIKAQSAKWALDNELSARRSDYLIALENIKAGRFAAVSALADFNEAVRRHAKVTQIGMGGHEANHSIVIVSHIHNERVADAMRELAADDATRDAEIVLVANGNSLLAETAQLFFDHFILVESPFPAGCCGGRNLGAAVATRDILVFLDDDGIPAPGCVATLLQCMAETGAVAVRGRVRPITNAYAPDHYDLGDARKPALTNCEGVSAWRRAPFLEHGGFNVALAGYEGVELCARMWPLYGPTGFMYEPKAVLLHDYVKNEEEVASKLQRYEYRKEFVNFLNPSALKLHRLTGALASTAAGFHFVHFPEPVPVPHSQPLVSVIVVASGDLEGDKLLERFARSWKSQSYTRFELVLVPFEGDQLTVELAEHFGDDPRLRVLERAASDAAAFDNAIASAAGEICLFANLQDLSNPMRIANTVAGLASSDYVFLLPYDETRILPVDEHPRLWGEDLLLRAAFGLPLPFCAFAFRKHAFYARIGEDSLGEWFARNAGPNVRGNMLHAPALHHAGTGFFKHERLANRAELARRIFADILGALTQEEERLIGELVGDGRPAKRDVNRLGDLLARAITSNNAAPVVDATTFSELVTTTYVGGAGGGKLAVG